MNLRTFCQVALGKSTSAASLILRALFTALIVAPAFCVRVESRLITLAGPPGTEAAGLPVAGESLVHVAIGGDIANSTLAGEWHAADRKSYQDSPLDRRFRLLTQETLHCLGGGDSHLLAGFHSESSLIFSFAAKPSGGGSILDGSLRPLGYDLVAMKKSILPEPPMPGWNPVLVPIFENDTSFDGSPGDRLPVSSPRWASHNSPNESASSGPAPWGSANNLSGSTGASPTYTAPAPSIEPSFPPPSGWSNPTPSPTWPTAPGGNVAFRASSSTPSPATAAASARPGTTILLASAPAAMPSAMSSMASSALVAPSSGTSSGTQIATPQLTPSANINYQFTTIGNPGNSGNTTTSGTFGAVPYSYSIGTNDVTVTQYCAFLNAVASSDPNALYNPNMGTDTTGGIIARSGSSGSYVYAVSSGGQLPITYVSWFDAARLANWMQNGQLSGMGEVAATTEQGAYTLNNAVAGIIQKNANATVWIPSENEWYKAAYYDPTHPGGYWTFATKSTTIPGNTANSSPNEANYTANGNTTNSSAPFLTAVGTFTGSASAYGTFDQNGDVFQWTDFIDSTNTLRGNRGGAWNSSFTQLWNTAPDNDQDPSEENNTLGIRLAAVVPEPGPVALLGAGSLLLFARRRKVASL